MAKKRKEEVVLPSPIDQERLLHCGLCGSYTVLREDDEEVKPCFQCRKKEVTLVIPRSRAAHKLKKLVEAEHRERY